MSDPSDNSRAFFRNSPPAADPAAPSPAAAPSGPMPGHPRLLRRMFHAWTGKSQTNLHLLLAVLFVLTFLAGKLLADSGVPAKTTRRLQSIAAAGMFLLLLAAFLHQNLHGSRNFLERFRDADHLPVRQLGEVSFSCMSLLLTAAALLMLGGAWLVPALWAVLARLFYREPAAASMELSDTALRLPEYERTDLTPLADAARPTPAWAVLLERLLLAFGSAVILLLLLAALLLAARKLYRLFTRKRRWDDDERIRLTPALLKRPPAVRPPKASGSRLPGGKSPDEKIRAHYRRSIKNGLRRQKKAPDAWAAPDELEAAADIRDPVLHELYEKARYSPDACTRGELEALRSRRKEAP